MYKNIFLKYRLRRAVDRYLRLKGFFTHTTNLKRNLFATKYISENNFYRITFYTKFKQTDKDIIATVSFTTTTLNITQSPLPNNLTIFPATISKLQARSIIINPTLFPDFIPGLNTYVTL